jgi:hypothetical protein
MKNQVVHAIVSFPDTSVLLAGTVNGGVYSSRDGGKTWRHSGLEGAQVWDLEIMISEGNAK